MKKLKKTGIVILVILLVMLLAGWLFVESLKPDYDGDKVLTHLSGNVEVYFDPYGIPHMYAENEEDAFRALGYVHAQDRLWQMELLRRVAPGRLSEVFGRDLLKTDQLFLSLGIDDATTKTLAQYKKDTPFIRLSEAYLDGVNQFVEEGPTPVEFYLTGLDKDPFTMRDILNSVGYMGFSFAMAHKTDPLLTSIRDRLGGEYMRDLEIDSDSSTLGIKNFPPAPKGMPNSIPAMVSEALEKLPIPQFIGSNSWVIAPGKTRKGAVILANDPHIGFAQPSVWYEAHLSTPTYEKYGYHLAGVPFPLLGHDRNLAYGITMFENDDVDFYYEENKPGDSTQYKIPGGWKAFEYITKKIKIKDSETVSFTYKKSIHGPVLNGIAEQVSGESPISMSWIYTKLDNKVMEALYGISHAADMATFQSALKDIHAPGLNIMYGDALGNIAWWATARLYQMPDSTNTKFILNGASGKDEPGDFLDFTENPHAINPPWKYVYSANNQPDSVVGMLYPGYYLPENRARRIVELLESRSDWDREGVAGMITDITSSVNPSIVANLSRLVDVTDLTNEQARELDMLSAWKGDYPLGSIQATEFHRWVYFFLKNTFEDELGPEQFEQFLLTHFHKRLIAPMARKNSSVWWDDITTKGIAETKKDIVHSSFVDAMESLASDLGTVSSNWTWGTVHTLEHGHPIGRVASLRSFFNVGPFPIHGTREVINNMAFNYSADGHYKVNSGPSTRRVIDFSDIENSISILPTGQSGNPFSPYYRNQAALYNQGGFRKMMMNREEIMETAESLITLIPDTDK